MKLKLKEPISVRVAGQITITGRVQLIAENDYPEAGIHKGDKVGKTISKARFYTMQSPKSVQL